MREKVYSFLFYNQIFKKVATHLLNSPWFVNNSVYQYFQNLYIKKIISKYKDTPNLVVIENTNLCNSHCSMCPHDVMKRKKGVMSEKLFQKIVDDCAVLGVKEICLHNFGEPLIDKDFAKKVAYAKSKGIPHVGTSTNGALLTEKVARKIILAGLDAVNFSLDAYSKEAYQKIRVGLPFEKVMQNVKQFISIRNQMGRQKPLVVVDLIKTKYNQGEDKKFIERWKNLADKVNITTLHSWGGSFKDKAGKSDFHSSLNDIKREPCRFLWTDMVILWDGKVSACCQDYDGRLVIGNFRQNSLSEIWRGKIVENLRKAHLKRDISKIPICNNCDYHSVWWLFK